MVEKDPTVAKALCQIARALLQLRMITAQSNSPKINIRERKNELSSEVRDYIEEATSENTEYHMGEFTRQFGKTLDVLASRIERLAKRGDEDRESPN